LEKHQKETVTSYKEDIKDKNNEEKVLLTGVAGFIGSHVVRFVSQKYPDYQIT